MCGVFCVPFTNLVVWLGHLEAISIRYWQTVSVAGIFFFLNFVVLKNNNFIIYSQLSPNLITGKITSFNGLVCKFIFSSLI